MTALASQNHHHLPDVMLLPSLLLLCTALPSACSNTSHPSKPMLPNLLCEEVPGLFPSRVHCSSFRSPLFVHAIGSRSHQIVIMYFHISFSHQRKLYCEYLWGKESGSFASSKLFLLSCSVMSDSLWPHKLQPARLLWTWDFPGKNTRVGCHFLLQGIFPTQGLNPCLLHLLLWQADSLPLSYLGVKTAENNFQPGYWQ